MNVPPKRPHRPFLKRHSLGLACTGLVVLLVLLYARSSPATHLGSFFGNAIADWTGVVVMVIGTKYLYERGSAESRTPHGHFRSPLHEAIRDHSLTIFLVVTGIGWIVLYARVDSEGKWGQVVGNIVSEWTQVLGLVLMTKRLIEAKSKESRSG